MGFFGGLIGSALGGLGESLFGKTAGIDGKALGNTLGSRFIPFAHGGLVTNPSQRVFNQNQMVVRKPKRNYQKSSGKKSRRKK
jgi:hypothetical protein